MVRNNVLFCSVTSEKPRLLLHDFNDQFASRSVQFLLHVFPLLKPQVDGSWEDSLSPSRRRHRSHDPLLFGGAPCEDAKSSQADG